ncbi:protein wntless-like isoform X2 [Penaeus monodon]|uniref:protein wntless-like isoform X2 n=1 Tax=Penaeus monodon TaxID=6687 RepID=UPI0018A77196|nr:protein wntless-like isoform X2 [Penaeus monodon]
MNYHETVLKNISTRGFIHLMVFSLLIIIAAMIVSGRLAPNQWDSITVKGIMCQDQQQNHATGSSGTWFWPDPHNSKCHTIRPSQTHKTKGHSNGYASQSHIVFAFETPPGKEGYSRWQSSLIALLRLRLTNDSGAVINHEARLGYMTSSEKTKEIEYIASNEQERRLLCHSNHQFQQETYDCSPVVIAVLYSLHHDHYIINIRLFHSSGKDGQGRLHFDGLGGIEDMYMTFITQTAEYTKVRMSLQTMFFPVVAAMLLRFSTLVRQYWGPMNFLQWALAVLAGILTILNCPLECLNLIADFEWLIMIDDFRYCLFRIAFLNFFHTLTDLHHKNNEQRAKVRTVMHFLISIACLFILLVDDVDHFNLLMDPLPLLWVPTHQTMTLCMFLLLTAFLVYNTFRVILAILEIMAKTSMNGRIFGINEREIILLVLAWLCVFVTAFEFVIRRLHDAMWIWEDCFGLLEIEHTSAFLLGVYCFWNVITCLLLLVFAPSPPRAPQPDLGSVMRLTPSPGHQGANPENGGGGQRGELVPRRSMRRYPLLRQNAVDDAVTEDPEEV